MITNLCVECSKLRRFTCCQDNKIEVYITKGDVDRIHKYTNQDEFYTFVIPKDELYQGQDDDPIWKENVFRSDGSRRILNRLDNSNCLFFGSNGCLLPMEVRPLLCRLFPLSFDSDGLFPELFEYCPTFLLRDNEKLLDVIGVNYQDAFKWHNILYKEILREREV